MPTQAEKSLPKPPAERATKAKKKKKRESGRSSKNSHSKKHTASEADSSSEGTRVRSKGKSGGTDDNRETSDDFTSQSRSTSSQNTSSRSWRTSSSDGRSTTCSGENFASKSGTNPGSSDENRKRESLISSEQTSSTGILVGNETFRWDFVQSDDPDKEEERLRIYKLHRRKRYMEFLHTRNGGEAQRSFYA